MGRLARVGDLRGAVRPLAPGDGGGGRKPLRRPAPPAGVACGAGLAAPVGGPGCRGLLPALRQALPGRRVRVHQHFAYAGLRGRHPGARDGGHRHRAVRSARAPRWTSAGICASSLSALPAGASSMPASTGPASAAGSSSVTCCIPASC